MNTDILDRRLDARLAALPAASPDAVHAERVRARCHDLMAMRVTRAEIRRRVWHRVIAPALVGSFCLVYFTLVLYGAFVHS